MKTRTRAALALSLGATTLASAALALIIGGEKEN